MVLITCVLYDWSTVEPVFSFISIILIAIEYFVFSLLGKSINPFKWINIDYKNSITNKIYLQNGFDEKELDDFFCEQKELKQQIENLNS